MTHETSLSRMLFAATIILAAVFLHYGAAYLINPVIPNDSYECIFNGPESTGEIITTCSLTIPNGTTYDFQPNSEQTGDEVDRPKFNYTGTEDYCQILMTKCFDFNSLGIYKLEVTYEDNTTESELCVVTAQASAFDFIPTSAVDVLPDQSAFFKFRDPIINIMGCIIQTISETTPDEAYLYPKMSNSSSDLLSYVSYWGKDEPGHCGAEVVYNPLNDTNLRLLYFNETYSMYADLAINGLPTPKPPRRTFFWHIGKTETLIADRDNISFCEMKDPSNVTVLSQATDKSCHYTRYGATVADDGIWRVLYWQKGDILSEVVEFDITVSRAMENSGVWTSVEVSEIYPEGVDLLCSMSSGYARSCFFVSPDGTAIVPHEGLGNERYLYYGKGLGTPDGYGSNAECGLTIRPKLQDEDHGEWKCVMEFVSTDYGTTKSKMAFLSVPKNTSASRRELVATAWSTELFVRNETSFELSCGLNSPLSYCWFRRPDGYVVPFSTNEATFADTALTYRYSDKLNLGECSMTVDIANAGTDQGEWTCNMGVLVREDVDTKATIQVTVAGSSMLSKTKTIEVSTDQSTTLTCYSVPRGTPIQYCRFVRPDGTGFRTYYDSYNSVILDRYQPISAGLMSGECTLMISSIAEEDLGQWTCLGLPQKLADSAAQEGFDVMTLEDNGLTVGAIVGIAVGGVVAVLLIAGGIFYVVRRKSK